MRERGKQGAVGSATQRADDSDKLIVFISYSRSDMAFTDRLAAEKTIKESDTRQKAILDNIPDIAWLKDREGRFIAVNEALLIALEEATSRVPDGLRFIDHLAAASRLRRTRP